MREYSAVMSEREHESEQYEAFKRLKEAEMQRVREEMKERVRVSEREASRAKQEVEEMRAVEEQRRDEIEARINEYEDTLNQKIRENSKQAAEMQRLKELIEKLELQVKEMKESQIAAQTNLATIQQARKKVLNANMITRG